MKLKNAVRLACLIETEGCINVPKSYRKSGRRYYHITVAITNTDMALLVFAKDVIEGVGCKADIIPYTDFRKHPCFKVYVQRLDDVRKILDITRKHMIGKKKKIADLVVSFLNFRKTLMNENGNLKKSESKRYKKAYERLSEKVQKINNQLYNEIEPVTTLYHPGSEELEEKV